jgi:putative PEP-CTERM system histidine kinase
MNSIGAIGYGAVGALYALLASLMMAGWHGGRVGRFLIVACCISSLWGVCLAFQTAGVGISEPIVFLLEVARGAAWLTFLGLVVSRQGAPFAFVLTAFSVWAVTLISGSAVYLRNLVLDSSISLSSVLIPGEFAITLVGLLLVSQLYRYTEPERRWGTMALLLGVGGMFAYDLFLYLQTALSGSLHTASWAARGAVNVLFVPMIAIAAKRSPNLNIDIFVSRQVVFLMSAILAIGLYLLAMSLFGYWIHSYGGAWGALAILSLTVGALAILYILLASQSLRARAKVFLTKHFFRNKYDYREEWLRLVSTLSAFEDSSTRQIVVKAMAQVVHSPAGVLWVLDDDGREYSVAAKLEFDRPVSEFDRADAMVEFIANKGWLIDLDEYRSDPVRYRDLAIPTWLRRDQGAWLIVPLIFEQRLLGMILLDRAPGSAHLNFEDRDLLKTIGNHIAVHLAQERSDSLLAESQQFEAYNRLTAFLMHDLNNLIAQQSLIVSNAEQHKRNPEFVDDAMRTIAGSVNRMRRIMDQLKRGETARPIRKVRLTDLVSAAVDQCAEQKPTPQIELNGVDSKVNVNPEQCIMVLVHMIKNAQEATPDEGQVVVSLGRQGTMTEIVVRDTGCGMSPEFIRDRLFRPFDTTKGSRGMGIGAYQFREFARKMRGDLTVESELQVGTTVRLSVPIS